MKILIADDDPVWVKIVSKFFSNKGHLVYSASNCSAALALAEIQCPDCVVLDCSLEDGSAAELCAAIKARKSLARAALIVVSGSEEERESCGADRFILKGTPLAGISDAMVDVLKSKKIVAGL